jgi:hypothetical protein
MAIQEAKRVADAAKSGRGLVDLGLEYGGKAIDKGRGINQENLIKSLEALVKQ